MQGLWGATAPAETGARGTLTLRGVHDLFPILEEREGNMGNQLSGGQQQMSPSCVADD